jgi:hypothetical protein
MGMLLRAHLAIISTQLPVAGSIILALLAVAKTA